MGLVTSPPQPSPPHTITAIKLPSPALPSSASMSQDFHHHQGGLFSFSDAFDRSNNQDQHDHLAQQTLLQETRSTDEASVSTATGIYEQHRPPAANVLSEMFNFTTSPSPQPSATELLAAQMQHAGGYHHHHPSPQRDSAAVAAADWHISADSAAAMQLFLMNPPQEPTQRSPSPPPPSATLHQQAFQQASFGDSMSFGGGGSVVEGQGLSLSLNPSFEMVKSATEDLGVREGVIYFNQQQQQATTLHYAQHQGLHMASPGYGSGDGGGPGMVYVLRTSKYSRPVQELLEEFCNVGQGQLKWRRVGGGGHRKSSANPNTSGGGQGSSSSTKEVPALPPTDRFEQQRKKAKLLPMLDEVGRRYNNYCDQMQMVVNSFDSVMGYGAATPYTTLAQKAMSRHFRCLKDAISAQLKHTCELLGEKDGGAGSSSGLTKGGSTPRLKLLDQSLRQQRAFQQMGIMEQEAWRPQRGLPERSVNILRAWLFEHFLNPYPSDADKHMMARQTGLSRNQVSNWFINARVRLWKPMVEEMYQQEAKEEDDHGETSESNQAPSSPSQQQQLIQASGRHRHIDTSSSSVQVQHHFSSSESFPPPPPLLHASNDASILNPTELGNDPVYRMEDYSAAAASLGPAAAACMRFGTSGDVSLTLGLRHVGNAARTEKGQFSVRDFSNC